MNKTFTCICCPRGCLITVNENKEVTGNSCPKGKEYVLSEINSPTRILTSTVRVINMEDTLVSVKTSSPIPKNSIFKMMDFINNCSVEAPCFVGDIIAHNPLGIKTDIIITKEINKINITK